MKKVLVLLLLMVSTNVFAEWTEVGGNDVINVFTQYTAYADFGTIKRKGNKVKMWYLYDFKKVQHVGDDRYLSSVNYDEYDCEEETVRWLDYYLYSGNMRTGEIVWSSTNIKKEPFSIMPGSVNETLFKIACYKKWRIQL